LEVTERTWCDTPARLRSDAYAVGFEIVRRLGVARLLELCRRAEAESLERVSGEWLAAPVESARD